MFHTAILIRALVSLAAGRPETICHADIKPANILLSLGQRDGRRRVALSDFGLAFRLAPGNMQCRLASRGTDGWMPPEATVDDDSAFRYVTSDTYTAALVILYWITGKKPVVDQEGTLIIDEAVHEMLPAPVLDIVIKMLSVIPMDRPNHTELAAADPFPPNASPEEFMITSLYTALNSVVGYAGFSILSPLAHPGYGTPRDLRFGFTAFLWDRNNNRFYI